MVLDKNPDESDQFNYRKDLGVFHFEKSTLLIVL